MARHNDLSQRIRRRLIAKCLAINIISHCHYSLRKVQNSLGFLCPGHVVVDEGRVGEVEHLADLPPVAEEGTSLLLVSVTLHILLFRSTERSLVFKAAEVVHFYRNFLKAKYAKWHSLTKCCLC